MSKQTSLPLWAQWTFGLALMTIAVAAGVLGLSINFAYGLQSDAKTAILYGLADLGKIIIPVVCATVGWRLYTRGVVFVCLVVSLWAAANYYADTQGRQLLAAEDQAARFNDARKDVERAQAELARIGENGQAVELRQAAAESQARAERESTRGGCARKCEDAKAEAARLIERAGIAGRRDLLEAMLARAKAERSASGGPAEASGMASLIAMAAGGDTDKIARVIHLGKTLIAIALVELLVFLNGTAAKMLGCAWSTTQARRAERLAAKLKAKAARARKTKAKKAETAELQQKAMRRVPAPPVPLAIVHAGETAVLEPASSNRCAPEPDG